MPEPQSETLSPLERRHYAAVLSALNQAGVEYLVGGGFGLSRYLGCWRATKDLDLFMRPDGVRGALEVLAREGFDVELTDPRWLAKARRDGTLTDIIFCSYNGIFPVDDGWFANARPDTFFEVPVRIVGPEEMMVSKFFVAARDRFDGSDVSRLIRSLDGQIDWQRVEGLVGEENWQVLLWQLVHFTYVFPDDRDRVPLALLQRLLRRLDAELAAEREPVPPHLRACRGPLLDPVNYRREVPGVVGVAARRLRRRAAGGPRRARRRPS